MADEDVSEQPQGIHTLGQPITIDDSTMDDIISKLTLLNYEAEFCPKFKPPFKPLELNYFKGPSTVDNANMQMYYFTSLSSWLMGICGHTYEAPGQFDDPSVSAADILTHLRTMELNLPNIAPNRLRQGNGESVLVILATLTDKALIAKNFQFQPIDYSGIEKFNELDAVTQGDADDVEVDGDEIADNFVVDSDEDEDQVYVRATGWANGAGGGAGDNRDGPQSSQVSAEKWALEVERVGPQLQIRMDEINDWRSRVETARVLMKAVDKMYPDVRKMLQRMEDDMDKARDRIQKREQTLAQQFSEQVEEYRVKLRELNMSQESANQANQSVQQLSMELNQVSEQLDQMKRDIEDREAKISDATPLMQVKEAVSKVQIEIKQMALRIGILQHTVLRYVSRQTQSRQEGTDMDGGGFAIEGDTWLFA